jgi:selenide,water dikinase
MGNPSEIQLTQFAHGSGCGCKVSPSILKEILAGKKKSKAFANLIVGNEKNDDAAVLKLTEDLLLISTTDFFMPIVDDAFDFGAIASANALSDVYAMGGKPNLALAILGWPLSKLAPELAAKVMQGAESVCAQAGIPIAGGHTIDSQEPFFGLSVNGIVTPKQLKTNTGVKKGDELFITKPLGTGIISSANRRGLVHADELKAAINSMKKLNSVGCELAKISGINAMTDITGFGLLGHLLEMMADSHLSAQINFDKVPRLLGVDQYLKQFIYPDLTTSNYNWVKDSVSELNAEMLFLLCDPQTSGGLMLSVNKESLSDVKQTLMQNDCYYEAIGSFEEFKGKAIFVN